MISLIVKDIYYLLVVDGMLKKKYFNKLGLYDPRLYQKNIKFDIVLINNSRILYWDDHIKYDDFCIDWISSPECRKFKLEQIFKNE